MIFSALSECFSNKTNMLTSKFPKLFLDNKSHPIGNIIFKKIIRDYYCCSVEHWNSGKLPVR